LNAREVYRRTRKQPDLVWNTYVARPVAALVVSALKDTRVTPDQVTLGSFVLACAAAGILLGVPGTLGLVLGVVLFELSYVLDCADGMLARWRQTASEVGHLLDFLMDELKAFVLLACVTARMFLERNDTRFLLLGLGGLVCLAAGTSITTFRRRPELVALQRRAASVDAASPQTSDSPTTPVSRSLPARAVGLALSFGRLLGHYPSYIWLVPIFGREEIYVYPYVLAHALNAAQALLSVMLRFSRPRSA
jgi:phosphatidylglycerophosphate synthase